MMFRTHVAFSFLIAVLFIQFVPVEHAFIFVISVVLLGSLPDLDTTKSKLGSRLWFLSFPISLIFRHRGFFHSVFPPLIIFFLLRSIGWEFLGLAVFVGYVAHLLGDALTVEGVNFLHPISTFRIQGFLRTGSLVEGVVCTGIIVADVMIVAKLTNIL